MHCYLKCGRIRIGKLQSHFRFWQLKTATPTYYKPIKTNKTQLPGKKDLPFLWTRSESGCSNWSLTDQFLSAGLLSATQGHPERAVSPAITDRQISPHATQSLHHLVELVSDSQHQQSLIFRRPNIRREIRTVNTSTAVEWNLVNMNSR